MDPERESSLSKGGGRGMASGLVGLYLKMESLFREKDLFQGLVEGRLPRQVNSGI